jgi:hypothetical protein
MKTHSYKDFMNNYILLIITCLFIVVYIIINYNSIKDGNITSDNLPKIIIYSGSIFLILYFDCMG